MSDRCLTVRIIDSELIFNHGIVHNILTEKCDKRKICAKLVPKKKTPLTNEQKEIRRNVCLDLHERVENDENFFKHVITGDESWNFEYDPETKRQSSSFWNCGQHPKCRHRPAEGTSTRRLPALLPGVAAASPAVCGFQRELL